MLTLVAAFSERLRRCSISSSLEMRLRSAVILPIRTQRVRALVSLAQHQSHAEALATVEGRNWRRERT